jgi:HEAT repeat protein
MTDPAPDESRAGDYEDQLAHYLNLLESDNSGDRWKGAEMLGRLGDVRAVTPLTGLLADDELVVRIKAAYALGMIGDPAALRSLQTLYRNETEEAQEIISQAMDRIKRNLSQI